MSIHHLQRHFIPKLQTDCYGINKSQIPPSNLPAHEETIYYQITHERKTRQLTTDYQIFALEWDETRSMVTVTKYSERESYILSIREKIHYDIERLTKIIHKLDASGMVYTAAEIVDKFHRYKSEYTLFNQMARNIAKLKQNGKIRTSETYTVALNSFKKFLTSQASKDAYRNGKDVMLDRLDSDLRKHMKHGSKTEAILQTHLHFISAYYVPSTTVLLRKT